jgi:hypothetical protein
LFRAREHQAPPENPPGHGGGGGDDDDDDDEEEEEEEDDDDDDNDDDDDTRRFRCFLMDICRVFTRCSRLISALPNVAKAVCTRVSPVTPAGGANYSIAFEAFPNFPFENNLFSNDGNPPLKAFGCDTTAVKTGEDGSPPVCYLRDLVTSSIKGKSVLMILMIPRTHVRFGSVLSFAAVEAQPCVPHPSLSVLMFPVLMSLVFP